MNHMEFLNIDGMGIIQCQGNNPVQLMTNKEINNYFRGSIVARAQGTYLGYNFRRALRRAYKAAGKQVTIYKGQRANRSSKTESYSWYFIK